MVLYSKYIRIQNDFSSFSILRIIACVIKYEDWGIRKETQNSFPSLGRSLEAYHSHNLSLQFEGISWSSGSQARTVPPPTREFLGFLFLFCLSQ